MLVASMSFLGMAQFIMIIVRMRFPMIVIMTMTVLMEDKEPENIERKTNATHDENKLGSRYFLWFKEPLYSFQEYGKA